MLHVSQLTELKANQGAGTVPKLIPGLFETLLKKTWERTVENSQQAKQSAIKLLIQENSRPRDLIVYTDSSRAHARTHARTHAHAHAHTHTNLSKSKSFWRIQYDDSVNVTPSELSRLQPPVH